MDFDSIISIILILLFFVAPSILKQLAQKKKKAGEKAPQRVTKSSLFERLGEQIREYAQTIERQGQRGEQGQAWEELAEDRESQMQDADVFDPDLYPDERDFEPPDRPAVREKPEKPAVKPKKPIPVQDPLSGFALMQGEPSSLQLRQAIIWSEILSKPIALRDNSM